MGMRFWSRASEIRRLLGFATAFVIGLSLLVLWSKRGPAVPRPDAAPANGSAEADRLVEQDSKVFAAEGQRLIDAKRLVLGRALLETARRLDPANSVARQALDALHDRRSMHFSRRQPSPSARIERPKAKPPAGSNRCCA